ncbi:hypothetical protein SO802_004747 [Lithocarpus litseifolius]|uniref:hAT-like transposase RNase-H fold domain-containing protein n=1 Tax=Lithocarpus litseifolius TaxID=425828 RepID=A0AAW2E7T0_9ROSI
MGCGGCSGCWLVATSCGGGCWSLGDGHCHCLCLVMEPSSDAPPPSQTTPTAQAEPVATPTNAKALPPKPNDKTKVMDNASSDGTTIKFLQIVTKDWKGTVLEHEFLHMRCCAHILNLIAGDGLKEIDASIARVHEAVRTFVSFLKLFYNATKKFSGSMYVTSNTFFDEMFVIQKNISHLIKSQNHLLKNLATKMEAKFENYWGKGDKINQLLYVVVVLDPRKKMRFLKLSFSKIYGDEVANEMVDLVRKIMDRLYVDCSRVDSPNVIVPSENERTHMEGDTIGCSDPYAMANS